jgi:hypothetical protein
MSLQDYKEWRDATGAITKGSSWDFELQSIIKSSAGQPSREEMQDKVRGFLLESKPFFQRDNNVELLTDFIEKLFIGSVCVFGHQDCKDCSACTECGKEGEKENLTNNESIKKQWTNSDEFENLRLIDEIWTTTSGNFLRVLERRNGTRIFQLIKDGDQIISEFKIEKHNLHRLFKITK